MDEHLLGYGLTDFLARKRRELAFSTGSHSMKEACKITWKAGLEPKDYVSAAGSWESESPRVMKDAVTALDYKRRPLLTEAVRVIERLPGGADWLKTIPK
ncbi:hypothetical protein PX52LOC_04528 [Limnoglobus roseus]|uniref:Uncharacterized protein n=1 Tax=Limnoglobus roseus TaxID=2598579 RepID=A0A5C1AKX6_9BACT|nr:hypothetical protein PX52LOC_04528 [Limnoglobus roseus]